MWLLEPDEPLTPDLLKALQTQPRLLLTWIPGPPTFGMLCRDEMGAPTHWVSRVDPSGEMMVLSPMEGRTPADLIALRAEVPLVQPPQR